MPFLLCIKHTQINSSICHPHSSTQPTSDVSDESRSCAFGPGDVSSEVCLLEMTPDLHSEDKLDWPPILVGEGEGGGSSSCSASAFWQHSHTLPCVLVCADRGDQCSLRVVQKEKPLKKHVSPAYPSLTHQRRIHSYPHPLLDQARPTAAPESCTSAHCLYRDRS